MIHKDLPMVVNTGFLVDRELFHPGDSFTIPDEPPWLKAGEMIGFFRGVAPVRAFAIHDATLNDNGLGVMTRRLSLAAAPSGAHFAV